jgi:crooked neck
MHAAHLEVRQLQLPAARKLLGQAIGRCPKAKLFREYIQLELQLGEVSRCRELYQRYLQWAPDNCAAWIAFAELESTLGELERARTIFGLAVQQSALDMPETLWKAYIDFEIEQGDLERARSLYRQLLDRTSHPKVSAC